MKEWCWREIGQERKGEGGGGKKGEIIFNCAKIYRSNKMLCLIYNVAIILKQINDNSLHTIGNFMSIK